MRFRDALALSDIHYEIHPGDRTRKVGKNLYAHYWDDGQIQRKDLYWFDGKTVLLESAWYKYNSSQWIMLTSQIRIYK